jgi:hypothetical protein
MPQLCPEEGFVMLKVTGSRVIAGACLQPSAITLGFSLMQKLDTV